jgi:hypothetical protein
MDEKTLFSEPATIPDVTSESQNRETGESSVLRHSSREVQNESRLARLPSNIIPLVMERRKGTWSTTP